MILQTILNSEWILGMSILFAMTILLTYMTYKDLETFFIWLTIFAGFVVWSGMLPLWVLILCLIVLGLIIVNTIYRKKEV